MPTRRAIPLTCGGTFSEQISTRKFEFCEVECIVASALLAFIVFELY